MCGLACSCAREHNNQNGEPRVRSAAENCELLCWNCGVARPSLRDWWRLLPLLLLLPKNRCGECCTRSRPRKALPPRPCGPACSSSSTPLADQRRRATEFSVPLRLCASHAAAVNDQGVDQGVRALDPSVSDAAPVRSPERAPSRRRRWMRGGRFATPPSADACPATPRQRAPSACRDGRRTSRTRHR